VLSLVTAAAGLAGRGLHIDASFTKQVAGPERYMRTYLSVGRAEFRGANRLLIAVWRAMATWSDGNASTP